MKKVISKVAISTLLLTSALSIPNTYADDFDALLNSLGGDTETEQQVDNTDTTTTTDNSTDNSLTNTTTTDTNTTDTKNDVSEEISLDDLGGEEITETKVETEPTSVLENSQPEYEPEDAPTTNLEVEPEDTLNNDLSNINSTTNNVVDTAPAPVKKRTYAPTYHKTKLTQTGINDLYFVLMGLMLAGGSIVFIRRKKSV